MKQNKDGLEWHGTTIVLIRKGKDVVVAGDGQVSIGNTVMKSTAKKVRKIEKEMLLLALPDLQLMHLHYLKDLSQS